MVFQYQFGIMLAAEIYLILIGSAIRINIIQQLFLSGVM